MTQRNLPLDGLRGIAALMVALCHCNTHLTEMTIWPKTVFDFPMMAPGEIIARFWDVVFNGDAAVVMFFVLSGYVLSEALRARHDKPQSAAIPYLLRRIFRLYPVAIIAAIPLIFLRDLSWQETINTMLLTDKTANGVIWSLQVELAGSVLIFLLWALRRPVYALAFIPAILVFGKFFPDAVLPNYILLFLPAFALGFLIREVPKNIWQSRPLFWLAFAALIGTDIILGRNLATRIIQILMSFAVIGCLSIRPFKFLDHHIPQFLGQISYPFYLLHICGMLLGTIVIHAVLPNSHIWIKIIVLVFISIPPTLLAAWLVHRTVELSGITWGSKIVTIYRNKISRV